MPNIAADRFDPAFADLRNSIRNDARISAIKALRALTLEVL